MILGKRTDQQYFDAAYQRDKDVFGTSDSWYEQRKRQVLLASLTKPFYTRVFEPGCGNGALSTQLGQRCQQLVMMDWSAIALEHARTRMPSHADLRLGSIPEHWPRSEQFDLIVISELLYYLDAARIGAVARLCHDSLRHDGEVALVHWRHSSTDYPGVGPAAHHCFVAHWPVPVARTILHDDVDFTLCVLAVS